MAYGFTQSLADYCLFVKESCAFFVALLVYVDDVLIIGLIETKILVVKQFLTNTFTIKDLGHAKYFFGLELA